MSHVQLLGLVYSFVLKYTQVQESRLAHEEQGTQGKGPKRRHWMAVKKDLLNKVLIKNPKRVQIQDTKTGKPHGQKPTT